MTTLDAREARSILHNLTDKTTQTHRPILLTEKRGNAVLADEEDWNAINETLYLVSIPGMRESIRVGIDSSLDDCDRELAPLNMRSTTNPWRESE